MEAMWYEAPFKSVAAPPSIAATESKLLETEPRFVAGALESALEGCRLCTATQTSSMADLTLSKTVPSLSELIPWATSATAAEESSASSALAAMGSR